MDEAARRAVDVTVVHASDIFADLARGTAMPDLQLARYRERAHDEGIALVDEVLEGVDVPNGVAVQRVINAGSPAAVLLSEARPERLLVVGTRGHGALGRMVFGSVSHQCLHHATGPVVVVVVP